ncbi:hypothetical protein HDU97_008817 [Phlyctochytrium planicorne]|nr:hypothetical protein HDU97_008817 [Phlyctochytrium planicorne]
MLSGASGMVEDQRLIFNVGGTKFETLQSTLLNIPESLLGIMFSDRNVSICKPDANGEYFFDRNATCFSAILDAYRGGDIICPPTVAELTFQNELDFWQIQREIPAMDEDSDANAKPPAFHLLDVADRKTLERTLMIMDSAQAMSLYDIEFLVDLDGNVAGIKQNLCLTPSQKMWWSEVGNIVASSLGAEEENEDEPSRIAIFERALQERTGIQKTVLSIREVRKTITPRRSVATLQPAPTPAPVRNGEGATPDTKLPVTYLSHWECTLVIP